MLIDPSPDRNRIALSIQQPWAELILRGIKTVEIRKTSTRIRGEVYLYAAKQFSSLSCAHDAISLYNLSVDLPRGCLVGSVKVLDCRASVPTDADQACVASSLLQNTYSWILGDAQRCPQLWPVECLPYGPWFYPFQRRGQSSGQRGSHGGS
jgi:hypothetical protein